MGVEVWRWGKKREIIYISLYCHHQNDSCIKKWAAMRDILMFHSLWEIMSQNSVHKSQPFWSGRRAEAESSQGPSAYEPNALPLGHTGSRTDL